MDGVSGADFLALHVPGQPLVMPNPWDAGSARILESMGFRALATTSSGFAATLGRLDGNVTADEALEHAATVVAAVDVGVSADLEDCYASTPDGVAEVVRRAASSGLAGCSIEDTGHEPADAVARVEAAVRAADEGGIVLTARADGLLHGTYGLDAAIELLLAFQAAGAHVLYVPRISTIEEVRAVVAAVDRPVNVLHRPGGPTVAELAAAGVARVSVGGAFAWAALGGLVDAATELLDHGTAGFWDQGGRGYAAATRAFS